MSGKYGFPRGGCSAQQIKMKMIASGGLRDKRRIKWC